MHKTRRGKMTVDVDEGKKAEEQSRFLAQLRATLNVIPAYTWYAAPSGGLTFVNERTADYLGLPKDHPLRFGIDIGAQWDAHIPLLHPDDHEKSRKSWSTCLRTGEFAEESFRVRNAQGGYRWFRSRVEPLRASDGTLLQWVGMNVDIDELKCAEQALRESEYKLRQIIETVPSLLWSTDPAGEPTQLSQHFFQSRNSDRNFVPGCEPSTAGETRGLFAPKSPWGPAGPRGGKSPLARAVRRPPSKPKSRKNAEP